MRRILDNVIPVGGLWGCGPESFSYPACFASLVMQIDQFDESKPYFCLRNMADCHECGDCGAPDNAHRKHGELNFLYLAITGIGLGFSWAENQSIIAQDPSDVYSKEEYIDWSMRYAGYAYSIFNKTNTDKEQLRKAIVNSVDRGFPVLAYGVVGTGWSLITGYDDDGEILIGWYGWYISQSMPDSYLENKMFVKRNWWDTVSCVAIVESKGKRAISDSEVFNNMISILEQKQANGYKLGSDAFDTFINFLLDDTRIVNANQEDLYQIYQCAHNHIGILAEARCFVGDTMTGCFQNSINEPKLAEHMREMGRIFFNSHDICWKAWAAMGVNHICEPEKYAERFREHRVRQIAADYIKVLADNDRKVEAELKECLRLL